jgi:DNA polymerase-1
VPGKKLILIDGNSFLYRAYYAIRQLSNSKGFPTNAIFGFITNLNKLVKQENPSYLGIVFDVKGPTVRHDIFKDYKAHRKPMPEDLAVQIPVLKKILKALHIPVLEHERYEADDVLGTLAKLAPGKKVHCIIVSTDKDLLQLVDETTTVYNPSKDIYLDTDRVKEHFGVAPSQVVDVLTLWGDPSDNIPGIPGVGEKTSKALINQFGSIENLLENLEQIKKPSLREKIENNLDQLELSRKLVTIEKELNLDLHLPDFSLSPPNKEDLISLYKELEFSSLISEQLRNTEEAKKKYKIIIEEDQLKQLISQIKSAKCVSLDTETDSPYPTRANLVGMSFSITPHQAYYLPLCHDYPDAPKQISKERALDLLKGMLTDPSIKKIGQNIKYDFIVLKREGVQIEGIDLDTMVLSYLLEPNWGKHNLNRLALSYLHISTIPYEEIAGKGKKEVTLNAVDIKKVAPYACQDADIAFQLSTRLWPEVKEKKVDKVYRELELPLIQILADMEIWGVKIDSASLKDLSSELQEELDRLKEKIYSISGEIFNLNSPQQLAQVLFEKMGLKPSRKTKKTKSHSTNVEVLQDLSKDHPIAQHALEFRQLSKLKSGYADTLPLLVKPETQRIHTSFNQTVAATGRLSSSDPNLQNIPVRGELGQRFRQAFIPEPGHLFLSADYSQIELRILAHLSQDPLLVNTFKEDHDVHQETAAQVFGSDASLFADDQRRRAKIINFSIIYGASAFSLAKELGTSAGEAQNFIDLYFEKYPKVKEFLERCVTDAGEKGFSQTLFGRIRQVPELRHENKIIQQAGRRIALNTPIQGTAADLIKKAMIDLWQEIKKQKLKSRMILQVHDELVFEVPSSESSVLEALVKEKMENAFPLDVPLKVHLGWGVNWAETK